MQRFPKAPTETIPAGMPADPRRDYHKRTVFSVFTQPAWDDDDWEETGNQDTTLYVSSAYLTTEQMEGLRDKTPITPNYCGAEFRVLDDDGVEHGRGWILRTPNRVGSYADFQPLGHWAGPDPGATSIEYRNEKGEWVAL